MYHLSSNLFPRFMDQDIEFLAKVVTDEEIKKALFDMAPLKAPRRNGFHAIFFQSQWDIMGNAVCEWVRRVFAGNNIDSKLNNTLIVLIPKNDSPKNFGQFHPIRLCSIMYKLVMKVISNRLKIVLPNLILQEQVRLIAGRNIMDNIIVAQEVIHYMRNKRKGKNWMTVKLDLKKAYDRVS